MRNWNFWSAPVLASLIVGLSAAGASAQTTAGQTTVTRSYTTVDPWGNRRTTTANAPSSAASAADYIARSAVVGGPIGGTTVLGAPIVAPGFGAPYYGAPAYPYGYGYGYPAPYPYPTYNHAPIQSGPLHPPIQPNTTPPWITSIPLGTTYSTCNSGHHHGCGHSVPTYPSGYYPYPAPGYGYGYGTGYYPYATQSSGVSLGYSSGGLSVSIGSRTTTTR